MKELVIKSSNGYLNLDDLPHNCLFNKVVTGCGGTTVALSNNENYVICVPTTELIINKTGLLESGSSISSLNGKEINVFGLYGKFDNSVKSKLKRYLTLNGVKKIMCTYDKLPKLTPFIDPSKYRLLVDEYHTLLKAYSYRDAAIDGILNSFKSYKSFCFMSATPIQATFKPVILNEYEEVVAKWDNTEKLKVVLVQTNKPFVSAANYINAYKRDGYLELNGQKSYEAFFFINSVNDIAAILEHCGLCNKEVKIVCANTVDNQNKLAGYTISNSRSEPKKFTFITSKSFEGADYYSDTAICFVVSSSTKSNTLAGIDTDIPQIAGRIRTKTNPFRNMLIHIFNSNINLNLDVSYDEMLKRTNKNIDIAIQTANMINTGTEEVRQNFMDKVCINNLYLAYNKETNTFKINDLLPKLELYNYFMNQEIYKNGISLATAYKDIGADTYKTTYANCTDSIKSKRNKLSFKEAFNRYVEIVNNSEASNELDEIAKIQPLVPEAFKGLGVDRVKALNYVQKAIKSELINSKSEIDIDNKIIQILSNEITAGFYSRIKIKELLTNTYKLVGLSIAAKAADINKWFECKEAYKRVDGKLLKGYNIIRDKFIFKK